MRNGKQTGLQYVPKRREECLGARPGETDGEGRTKAKKGEEDTKIRLRW